MKKPPCHLGRMMEIFMLKHMLYASRYIIANFAISKNGTDSYRFDSIKIEIEINRNHDNSSRFEASILPYFCTILNIISMQPKWF